MGILLTPFVLLLLFFYNFFGNYGVALILFALVVKILLFPLSIKGKKSMIQMNLLSGRIQQIQKQFAHDPNRRNQEIQKLYEKEKVNPMGGCLWSLLPAFILLPLYYIIREPLTNLMGLSKDMVMKVSEVTGILNQGANPQITMAEALNQNEVFEQVKAVLGEGGSGLFQLDFSFLGINLADVPQWNFWASGWSWASIGLFLIPLVSVGISLLSMQVTLKTNQMNQNQSSANAKSNRTMMLMMPMMSLWIGFTVPAGLSLYWIAQYIFTIFQELLCGKLLKKDYEAAREAAAQREREEKEEEKRRREEHRLERLRLQEEKKNRGKKKEKKPEDGPVIHREDSSIGMRTYARGRAYLPDRFGAVTPYTDPNEQIRIAQLAREKKGKSHSKKK